MPRPSVRPRRFPAPDAWRRHRDGPARVRSRYRPAGPARPDAAPRRSARGPPRQNRPSARRRLPATPAAGRSSIATPARRRAPWRRRRSAPAAAPVRTAPGHGRRAIRRPRGSAGSPSVTPAWVQRIGAEGSTGASRSSPSAAPSAFSKPLATVMPSMIGGQRFLVSPLTILEIVRASVSSRCTRLSASLRGRGRLPAFAARRHGRLRSPAPRPSDCARFCCAVSMAPASAARSPRSPVSCASFCSSLWTLAMS